MARKRNSGGPVKGLLIVLILLMIAASGVIIWLCVDLVNQESPAPAPSTPVLTLPAETEAETEPPETTMPEPEHVVATATVASMGDILMHKPVFDTGRQSDGSYNFDSIFRYVKEDISAYDYALANLETTLGGPDCGIPYQGNPNFNCPDPIADALKEAGYDMLLTANNHASDTKAEGIIRTLEQVRSRGLATLGTMLNGEEPAYEVVDINGIKVGMICYTYATGVTGDGLPRLNGNLPVARPARVNYFMENNLDQFYSEVGTHLENMRAEGAEATMLYIHWGVEYQLQEKPIQRQIAQKLCDMGIDVIVGGHPHVVEPVALLESTVDPDHKSVVIYSMGNAVSNQRTGISNLFPAGYTEDGALFEVTFEKYSDGKVYLAGADVLPTWVNMHSNSGTKEYNILPLDLEREGEWQERFNLTDANLSAAKKSYDRTMGIVGDGLRACQDYLEQAKLQREEYYFNLAFFPDKAAAPTEMPTEEPVVETTGAWDQAA